MKVPALAELDLDKMSGGQSAQISSLTLMPQFFASLSDWNPKEPCGKRPSGFKMENNKICGDPIQLNRRNKCFSQILNALEMKPV